MDPLPAPKPSPPKSPERWPFAVRLGVATGPEVIASGWESFGFAVDVGVRYRAVSFGVEAHGDPPLGSVVQADVRPVSVARMSAALLVCAHYGWFAGCGVADMGRFLFPGHAPPLPPSAFYGAAGVRAGLEFPVAPPRLFIRTTLDVRAPIHPVTYLFGHTTVFEAAGPGVGLGLGVVVELPAPASSASGTSVAPR